MYILPATHRKPNFPCTPASLGLFSLLSLMPTASVERCCILQRTRKSLSTLDLFASEPDLDARRFLLTHSTPLATVAILAHDHCRRMSQSHQFALTTQLAGTSWTAAAPVHFHREGSKHVLIAIFRRGLRTVANDSGQQSFLVHLISSVSVSHPFVSALSLQVAG